MPEVKHSWAQRLPERARRRTSRRRLFPRSQQTRTDETAFPSLRVGHRRHSRRRHCRLASRPTRRRHPRGGRNRRPPPVVGDGPWPRAHRRSRPARGSPVDLKSPAEVQHVSYCCPQFRSRHPPATTAIHWSRASPEALQQKGRHRIRTRTTSAQRQRTAEPPPPSPRHCRALEVMATTTGGWPCRRLARRGSPRPAPRARGCDRCWR